MEYRCNTGLNLTGKVHHGGTLASSDHEIIDYSVSLNPYPLPEPVRETLSQSDPINYPDTDAGELISLISRKRDLPEPELMCVNGISQGIFLISMLFIEPGDPVLVIGPTYGEYEKNSRLFGAEICRYGLEERDAFRLDTDDLADRIRTLRPKLVWLCNPNNPTGRIIPSGELHMLADCCEDSGSLLIIDDAYIMLSGVPEDYQLSHPAVVTMHSLTKDFSLAGLRIGYIHAPEQIISMLGMIQPEWSMNSHALDAATAALQHEEHYRRQWQQVIQETASLEKGLQGIGIETIPTDCNIILARKRKASTGEMIPTTLLQERLLSKGITVRDCNSFGLPDHFRIGTRTAEENTILLTALKENALWEA